MEIATSLNVLFGPEALLPQSIARCAAAGFRALDFNYCDYQQALLQRPWSEEERWARGVREAADAAGARFVQAHGPMFAKLGSGEAHEALVAQSDRCLRTAAILGAAWVVFEPDTAAGAFDATHRRALRDGNAAFVRRLLPAAEETGVGIALENCPDSAASGGARRWYGAVPDELGELIDALDHPLVGACWDTGHAHMQGLDQHAALRALGPRLKATHIADNDGRSDQHLLPYHGTVDWRAVIRGLADAGYAGPFAYEVPRAVLPVPDALRDELLRYAHNLAQALLRAA